MVARAAPIGVPTQQRTTFTSEEVSRLERKMPISTNAPTTAWEVETGRRQ